jgi:hypothetical protein
MQDPALPASQFFSPSTGDAVRWFTRRRNGHIDVFTLPGFHPTFGVKLLPVDATVVAEYERQQTEAERNAQVERDRKRAEEEREHAEADRLRAEQERQHAEHERQEAARRAREEAARLRRPLQVGRYVFPDPPQGTVDGMKFTLPEIDLTAAALLAHVAVENTGADVSLLGLWRNRNVPRYVRFALMGEDGVSIGYTSIHATDGSVTERNGSVSFPAPGNRGAFVMEFSPPRARTFSLTVNDQPVFAGINLHNARYETF